MSLRDNVVTRRRKLSRLQPHKGGYRKVPRVGFYGCDWMDRIVRVGIEGPPRHPLGYPRSAIVDCPCGRQHRKHITWRILEKDEDVRAEVTVHADPGGLGGDGQP